MPPHCDSIDGPVVTVARQALEKGDVKLILPYVPKEGEEEVIKAFNKVLPLHRQPNGARYWGASVNHLELATGDPAVQSNFVEMRRITSELADVALALAAAEDAWLTLEERAP